MFITIFVCIGFMLAILYIDLMFDVLAVPHRRGGAALPKDVLDPITYYYGRVTQNPYVLMFVMLTTTIFLVLQIVYGLAPRWAAYASLAAMGLAMVAGIVKVIPTAQQARLRQGFPGRADAPHSRCIHGARPSSRLHPRAGVHRVTHARACVTRSTFAASPGL